MILTLVYPSIGKKEKGKYVKSWQMEPLAMAILAGLTPDNVRINFYDDRFEEIPFDEKTDLVGISVETFTAKRSYEIAAEFMKRGVKVVMGGYHPTFMTDEALGHCDSVVIGEAENVWAEVLRDAEGDRLKRTYESDSETSLSNMKCDRSIFDGKKYFDISLIETGRGCKYHCNFCSITEFFKGKYRRRPVAEVVREIKMLDKDYYFFVDDNVASDSRSAKELFRALKPLGINWVSQVSIDIAKDDELLDLMRDSGCLGVLIGFESLQKENLLQMGKSHNAITSNYSEALDKIRKKGIIVYGAFVIGYDYDDHETVQETLKFGIDNKLFLIAFNHLTPFPGTPIYNRLKEENRLAYEKWWLSPEYRFGEAPFYPRKISADELGALCLNARKAFYGIASILKRAADLRANCRNWKLVKAFFILNLLLRKEVNQKNNIVLGNNPR